MPDLRLDDRTARLLVALARTQGVTAPDLVARLLEEERQRQLQATDASRHRIRRIAQD